MTPEQAAAVWARVPDVESGLTAKTAGLSNILTGLAFVGAAIPWLLLERDQTWTSWNVSVLLTVGSLVVFFTLRSALWKIHGAATASAWLGRAYDKGDRPGYLKWYIGALVLYIVLSALDNVWPGVPGFSLFTLLVAVYAVTMGHWESRKPWVRRPYLLALGSLATAGALAVDLWSGAPIGGLLVLGLGWMGAGLLLYYQV